MRAFSVLAGCILMSACAVNAPVSVEQHENIGHLAKKMAQSYNAGVAKVVTSIMPMDITEFETLREAQFKVRTSAEKAGNIFNSFRDYCVSKGGLEYPPTKQFDILFGGCARKDKGVEQILFLYWVHETPVGMNSAINCYSILATENRELMPMKEFGDYAQLRFKTVLENKFFNSSAC